jgi:hypothetical protein
MTHSRLLALTLSLPFAACQSSEPAPADEALRVEQHDAAVVRGSFVAGVKLEFQAVMPRPAAATVTVTIGGDTLTLFADATSGEIHFDGGAAQLSTLELDTLGAFTRALDGYIGGADDVAVMHESLLLAASGYFAAAPADTALENALHFTDPLSGTSGVLGNDGKACIKPGEVRTAAFDGSQGAHYESWTVGSHGGTQWNGTFDCMGRCGAGCGSYDWTQDCLEHDACSRKYYSSSGPVDQNCGDEYSEAADDYTAFWKRCYR